MLLRTLVIAQLAAGTAAEAFHLDDLRETLKVLRQVGVHPESRNRIPPDGDDGFFEGCGDMHQAGVVRDHLLGLPDDGSGLVDGEYPASVEYLYAGRLHDLLAAGAILRAPQQNDRLRQAEADFRYPFCRVDFGVVLSPDPESEISVPVDLREQVRRSFFPGRDEIIKTLPVIPYPKLPDRMKIPVDDMDFWQQVDMEGGQDVFSRIQFGKRAGRFPEVHPDIK